MLTTAMEVRTEALLGALGRADDRMRILTWAVVHLPAPLTDLFAAFFARKLCKEQSAQVIKLAELGATVSLACKRSDSPIDPNLEIRSHLEQLKAGSLRIRARGLSALANISKFGWVRTHAQFSKMVKLACEEFEIANAIQWELAEHDASFSAHLDGYVASTANDIQEMLTRLSDEA